MTADADGYISLSWFCEEALEEVRSLVGKLRDVADDLEVRADGLDRVLSKPVQPVETPAPKREETRT